MNRRRVLAMMAGVVALPCPVRALTGAPQRWRLHLRNPHTGETFEGSFRDGSGPLATAMEELSTFLRDFHSGEKIAVDIGVLDFLASVMDAVGLGEATILSAYRTQRTNAILARTTFGVAENSQHVFGRALDVHFGSKLDVAMQAARAMQRGGVGWYPHSGFMHIDTGPVRNWELGLPELRSLLSLRPPPVDQARAPSTRAPSIRAPSARALSTGGDRAPPLSALEQSGRALPRLERSGRMLSRTAGMSLPR